MSRELSIKDGDLEIRLKKLEVNFFIHQKKPLRYEFANTFINTLAVEEKTPQHTSLSDLTYTHGNIFPNSSLTNKTKYPQAYTPQSLFVEQFKPFYDKLIEEELIPAVRNYIGKNPLPQGITMKKTKLQFADETPPRNTYRITVDLTI